MPIKSLSSSPRRPAAPKTVPDAGAPPAPAQRARPGAPRSMQSMQSKLHTPPASAPVTAPTDIAMDALDALVDAVLRPDAHAVLRADANPGGAAQAMETLRPHAHQVMNALRTLAPMLRAVTAAGGVPADQRDRFNALAAATQAAARVLAAATGCNPDDPRDAWALRAAERAWVEAGAPALTQEITDAWVAAAAAAPLPTLPVEVPAPALRVHLAAAMGPLLRRSRPDDATLAAAAAALMDQTARSLQALLVPLTAAPDRQAVFAVLLAEHGRLLADAWVAPSAALPADQAWARTEKIFRDQAGRLTRLAVIPRPRMPARRASANPVG